MRRTLTDGRRVYTISPDVEIQRGWLASAIVSARLVDELTDAPPRGPIRVSTGAPELTPRVAGDGLVGCASVPVVAFPLLRLQAYTVRLAIDADGYVPLRRQATLGPQPGFPDFFTPADLGRLDLHREPVRIRGRVTRTTTPESPAAGATVRVTGIWRTFPGASAAVPAAAPNLVSLRPAVYFDRTRAAGGVLRQREMAPVAGDSRVLLDDLAAGSTSLRVSNRTGVAAGGILLVDAGVPDRAEYLTVQSVAGASSADEPATIVLSYAARNRHPVQAVVQRVTPQGAGADNTLQADAAEGDACVLLDSMNALAAAQVAEIAGGGPAAEYHLISRFEASADASGYYRLPPISRVALVQLQAEDGANPPSARTVSPDYELVENLVDFRIAV